MEDVQSASSEESEQMQAPVIEDEFSSIREHFESDIDLTDEEVDKIADVAVTYIRELLGFFGEEHISIDEYDGDEGELILDISGGDLAVLIGRHGKTLDALKSRRREKLAELARSAAARAKKQHGRVAMAPMNAYDRRIVHLALIDDDEVTTHSEGNEPERRVIVTYVKA